MLSAKRKKRRRKEGGDQDEFISGGDDLPDFDLTDDDLPIAKEQSKPSKQPASTSATANTAFFKADPDVITPNMMASSSLPAKSLRELIGDRSLEKKLIFDDTTTTAAGGSSSDSDDSSSLPDLVELARQSRASQTASPKRQKQAARKAAAQSAAAAPKEGDEDDITNLLSKIPFTTNEKGQVTPTKLLEAATWLGIFLLVAWEVYLNSPFFDRAGPMAPVVY